MASPINPGTPAFPPVPPPGGQPQLPPGPPLPPRPAVPYRRRSIFSGLLLVIVGVLLLIATLRPGFSLGYVISHFWPVIIIIWGISRLIDRYAMHSAAPPGAIVSGGELGLVFLLVALVCFVAFIGWVRDRRQGTWDLGPFTAQYSQTQQADSGSLRPGSWVSINTPNGNISVQPGPDNAIHAVANETARAQNEQQARDRLRAVNIATDRTEFGLTGDGYSVRPVNVPGGNISVDLNVQVPKNVPVNARTQRGGVTVADVQGPTNVTSRGGDLQIHDVGAGVTADLQNGDAHIRNVSGPVTLNGRGGGDLEITDVQGDTTISGNVFGDVDLRNVAKGVHYSSPRASVQVTGLPGELKIDNSDIVLSRAVGPITISARNQDLRLDQVQGQLDLTETHGDINVTFTAPPKDLINITNDSGDVTLNLPPQSNFSLMAQSNSGDITDDFAPNPEHDDDHGPHVVNVTHGSGGPTIRIVTKYGDIHIGNSQ